MVGKRPLERGTLSDCPIRGSQLSHRESQGRFTPEKRHRQITICLLRSKADMQKKERALQLSPEKDMDLLAEGIQGQLEGAVGTGVVAQDSQGEFHV